MKRSNFRSAWLVTIVLALVTGPALGQEGKRGTTPGSGKAAVKTAPAASGKGGGLQQALDTVKSGKSIEDIGQKIGKLNLSAQDKQRLADALKQPPYADILERLTKRQKDASDAAAKTSLREVENRQRQLAAEKNRQILKPLNLQVQQKVTALKATVAKRPLTRPAPVAPVARATAQAPARPGGGGPLARVSGVSPQPAVVSGNVTISGENFGPTPRKVLLDLGRSGTHECVVDSWGERQVVVRFPEAARDAVGETEKAGRIYIVLPEIGQDVRVVPEPGSLVPAITSLSSATIRPGQSLVVEGDNFLTERRGTVTFRFTDRNIDGSIDDWAETYVAVRLPEDVQGLPETAGVVKVRNHAGQEVSRSITFQPKVDIRSLHEATPTATAFIFGQKFEWKKFDFKLLNGWVVRESHLETQKSTSFGGGCRYLHQPVAGDDAPRSTGEVWMDFFGYCDCWVYVTIEGPAGVPYQ